MNTLGLDSYGTRRKLEVGAKTYEYYGLKALEKQRGFARIARLPFSLKVLLENLLRHEDGRRVARDDIKSMARWLKSRSSKTEIAYRPARVLMQDFTGVPAVVDLAAMRDAMADLGGDPETINPLAPVDLVIDHSVMVDFFGTRDSFRRNVEAEYERNGERYAFLRWGSEAFDNFRVVPPGKGICHQVNLEYFCKTVWSERLTTDRGAVDLAYPDTLVGTDSHTTMVNGLAVLGWGVGGIEAEAAMLGHPVSMLIPEVVGFEMTGRLGDGVTATDMVLTVTEMLRKKGVVGKFVEFFGSGLDRLSLEDRATIANMAPEYGATCGFFPIDKETLAYLKATGRSKAQVDLVETYAKAQGMFRTARTPDPLFTDTLHLDLSTIEPCLAGPKRPQDRIALKQASKKFANALKREFNTARDDEKNVKVEGKDYRLDHGDVVLAAITSCTNTSNPSVMIGAGLLARNALKRGLAVKPWVKTSLAPGSQVVTEYLTASGLQKDLNRLGFDVVGYGCTTCIGNSGPLPPEISEAIRKNDLVVASVLSGNRNFEGRVNPDVKANYLASPPLVVAYALAGSMTVDVTREPLGRDKNGAAVYLEDIWPASKDVAALARSVVKPRMFRERYADIFKGDGEWRRIEVEGGRTYDWNARSTYVRHPPYFEGMTAKRVPVSDIVDARVLGLFGDSITTDHISPAGAIKRDGPAGDYLADSGVEPVQFNSFGSRRGNHEVMMRGTFANIRIRNEMAPGTEGGVTVHHPSRQRMTVYDAAMRYAAEGIPLVVFAGKEYGTGSSRDWAAKGTRLLGVRAVIAESFERIHRSNLIGMGVLPLQFRSGTTRKSLGLTGEERVTIRGLEASLRPRAPLVARVRSAGGGVVDVSLLARIDTQDELEYFKNGGILHFVLRGLLTAA